MTPPPAVSLAERARNAADLIAVGQLDAAARILKGILAIEPDQIDALLALGTLAGMQGRLAEAVKHLRRAARLDPDAEGAHYNLGQALIELGRHAEAAEALQRAAQLADQPHIHEKLGDCLRQLGKLEEAARHFVRAVELDPGNSLAASSAVETLRRVCDWSQLDGLERSLITRAEAGGPAEPLLIMHVSDDPALQRRVAETYWRTLVEPRATKSPRTSTTRARASGGKVRLGYMSADFRRHPMVSVIAEVIELHDRSRFDVAGYSYGPDDGSAERQRMQKAFDRFQDVRALTDEQLARRIADNGIDILVDLAGYTANARLGVVAAHPAPIVCHYMGFPGTLGSKAYDYLIADHVVVPAGATGYFSEALVRLPDCYWAVDRKRAPSKTATSRREHGLPEDAVVLCSFNGQQKLSPPLLDVWARILTAVPESVLWLYSDNAAAASNLRREAVARGIGEHRLVPAGRVPQDRHLARIQLADLMLDALPYGGHTTACDSLWMGVPVLTVAGRSFASRVGASLLTAAGLPELIMPSLEVYEREAIALASNRSRLGSLKSRLAATRTSSALFDTVSFTRHLEAAFIEMVARHRRGERPSGLELAS